jgi:transcriptional regulator with XRE-family HTH domain
MSLILEKIGTKIRSIRQSKNLTQEQMADLLNMSHSGYSKIERGETDMTLARLEEIAKIFGTSPSEVLQFGESQNITLHIQSVTGFGSAFGSSNNTVHLIDNKEEFENLKKDVESMKTTIGNLQAEIVKLKK